MIKKTPIVIKQSLQRTAQRLRPAKRKDPDELLGSLFHDIQTTQVFADGKTFVDLIPRRRARRILQEYQLARQDPNFRLDEFVTAHFYEFEAPTHGSATPAETARQHVSYLWGGLVRHAEKPRGSLIALPYEYVVPGGRFAEQFYWDSYFIMLGLAADGKWRLIEGMMKNYAYMIQRFGFIPTANRTYFLSRSQPPFLAAMVKLLAAKPGRRAPSLTYLEYLPSLLAEYKFWMAGQRTVDRVNHPAHRRVVSMPNGAVLNRYFDDKATPRPESRREDLETAAKSQSANKPKVFLDLRAGAESGWDFSSRWFMDPTNIETIITTDIVPVDLNCLLYELELAIAHCYGILRQSPLKKRFLHRAERRAEQIRQYCWDERTGFFYDYNLRSGQLMPHATLAAVFALYNGVATDDQAARVAERLERDFLRDGGLRTTLVDNGQQWDAPNGWAPLQWVAYVGLRRYGFADLATEVRARWMASTEQVFAEQGKMIEKYDVESKSRLGGGGEYPLQDGFGWTNGVYAALHDELEVPY